MLPCGIAGAVVIAGWLVEAKQSVIENIAPVLTRVFTPLFTLLLLALIVAGLVQGNPVDSERDLLILFDVMLIVVLGLLLYSLSARDSAGRAIVVRPAPAADGRRRARDRRHPARRDDRAHRHLRRERQQARIARAEPHPAREPRRRRRGSSSASCAGARPTLDVERWQTSYVPVYLAWAVVVAVVFPPVFGFA